MTDNVQRIREGIELARLRKRYGRLIEAVSFYFSQEGVCGNVTGDGCLCSDPECAYCTLAREVDAIEGRARL